MFGAHYKLVRIGLYELDEAQEYKYENKQITKIVKETTTFEKIQNNIRNEWIFGWYDVCFVSISIHMCLGPCKL